jgi:Sap, sulfolipid-1-addressing protein
VIDAGFHVVLYAIVAAASPLVLTATFVVIRSARPRTNGIAFLIGFLIGTTLACIVGLIVGQAAVDAFSSHDTVEDLLTLALGLALVVFGIRAQRRQDPIVAEKSSRVAAIMEGLRNVRPAAACSMAGLLGFGGPKRLLLTLLAMGAVTSADVGRAANLTLGITYVAIATVLVWVPVGIVVVAGERAAAILERGESWLTTHARALRIWIALGFGGALVVDAILRPLI